MPESFLKSPPKIVAGSTARLQLTVATTVYSMALPTLANGESPKYVLVATNTHGVTPHIAFGDSTVQASLTKDGFYPPDALPMIFDVSGYTHVSAVTPSGSCSLMVTPLENF